MTYRVLTRTADAERAIETCLMAQGSLQRWRDEFVATQAIIERSRARAITRARQEGVSILDLAIAFGKSPEWVRQAEKKGQTT